MTYGIVDECRLASSFATPSPHSGIRIMRPTMMPAPASGESWPRAGVRLSAAPRRMRLMGTAAAPSFEMPMYSQPSGAVSGGSTSWRPKSPTTPPATMPTTCGTKVRRSSLPSARAARAAPRRTASQQSSRLSA